MPEITVANFTTEDKTNGTGVFDTMMRSVKEHIADEYNQGRIQGTEYSTVYLGALQSVMDRALTFVLEKDKRTAEIDILQQELLLTQERVLMLQAEKALVEANTLNAIKEGSILDAKLLNVPKEGAVLDAQECKLKSEFDLLVVKVPKVQAETGLLNQKKVTEQAQTNGAGVDEASVVGKQISLYGAQADGFSRDAEQKAAKLMIDTWNVRRTTDEATAANTTNGLDDTGVGRVVTTLLDGVNA
jgi:hypothetical protein